MDPAGTASGMFRLLGQRHHAQVTVRHRQRLMDGSSEIFVEREKPIRLQFPKYSAELLPNSVDGVKKNATLQFQLPATEPPVGSQQKVELENAVFERIERTFAYQAEVRRKFLTATPPTLTALLSRGALQGSLTHVFFLVHAIAEPVVTRPKNGPKHAIARSRLTFSGALAHTSTVTYRARRFSQRQCFRMVPFHDFFLPAALNPSGIIQLCLH